MFPADYPNEVSGDQQFAAGGDARIYTPITPSGADGNGLELRAFDPADSWSTAIATTIVDYRFRTGGPGIAGLADGRLYIFEEATNGDSRLVIYDPGLDTVSRSATVAVPRLFTVHTDGRYVYLAGEQQITATWRYDPELDAWSEHAAEPPTANPPRYQRGAVDDAGRYWLPSAPNALLRWDPADDAWAFVETPPETHAQENWSLHLVVSTDGVLYAFDDDGRSWRLVSSG